jgi:hypothetical protein
MQTFPVRERMMRRYQAQSYPSEFPAKVKGIVLFQNIDGVDVILFAMCVGGLCSLFCARFPCYVCSLSMLAFTCIPTAWT